jgi:Concanavalin A-like lectin/glucanases superfamily
MTTITITGKVKRAIWNLPLTSARVSVALKAIYGDGETVYPSETQTPPYKVDTDGTINGSGGFEVQAPTVASGNTAQYGFTVLLLDADGETETQPEQTALLNDPDTSLALEDALSGGGAGTGGEITVSGLVYHPFGDGIPYSTGIVTVALVTQFITDDGLFPAISADIPIKDGYFNGDVDLILYVPDGQSEWLFTFPDGSSVTAMLGTHTSMVEIADIANGDYATELDPMNVPTSFNATLDGADVDLTWTDTNSDETGYRIERSDDSGATWDAVTVTAGGATSYTNTSVPTDTYIYRIRAEKSGGQSAWVTDTIVVSAPPNAPTGLTATPTGTNNLHVLLNWTDNSDNETGFIVEYSTDNATWSELTTTAANATTYTHTTPTYGQVTHYYRVRAESGAGESANATASQKGRYLGAVFNANLNEGSGNRATQISGLTLTDNNTVGSVAGILSNAALFVATNNESLSHANNAVFSVGDGDFTLRVWTNLDASQTNPDCGIMTMDNYPSAGREWHILYVPPDVRFNMQNSADDDIVSVSAPVGASAWHRVLVTRLGANISVYVDGGTPATGTIVGTPNTGAATFRLGSLGTGTSYHMDGATDDVIIVKGRVWSAAEIAEDYNSGAGVAYPN